MSELKLPAGFPELICELKKIPLDETRKEVDGYFECVIRAKELARIYPVLEKYFGLPFKPPGVDPTKEAKKHAKDLGGILKQQTLYYVENKGLSNCAMIWPWNDDACATVKLAQGQLQK